MNRIPLLALAFLVFAAPSAAEQDERKIRMGDLPPAVRDAFEKQFPKARVSGVSEEKASDGIVYEIECRWQGRKHDVTFKPDGSLVSVEETIPVEQVPAPVMAALKTQFPSARIKKAEKVTESGAVAYEFELRKAVKKEVKFAPDGKLLEAE